MQVLLFYLISFTLGFLSDRERASQRALQESKTLAAMGEMVSSIAHDIKMPLVVIGGYSRSVIKKIGEDDPNRKKLDIIIKETERLENMAINILVYSRPLQLNRSAGDLNQLLREYSMVGEQMVKDRKVRLELLLSENLPKITFDPAEMERVKTSVFFLSNIVEITLLYHHT